MSYRDTLSIEINKRLDDLQARGETIAANWVAHDICVSHKQVLAADLGCEADVEFYGWCAYTATRDLVRREIARRAADEPERAQASAQFVFPGFEREHIQDYYLVRRDNEEVMAPIALMSDGEVRAKAALYRAMALGNMAHADELDRYLIWRAERQVAAAAE